MSSSGRSGSKGLAAAFQTLPEVTARHGSAPLIEKENCLHYKGKLANAKGVVLNARHAQIAAILKAGNHYVESAWFLSALGGPLKAAFPGCRIVHLVRDGRDFVRSGMARRWFKNHQQFLRTVSAWSRDHWTPPPKAKSRVAKIAWLWATQQKLIAKHADVVIHFEDIIQGGVSPALLGLPGDPVELPHANATGKHVFPKWTEWDEKTRADFNRFAGPTLTQFGYAWEEAS